MVEIRRYWTIKNISGIFFFFRSLKTYVYSHANQNKTFSGKVQISGIDSSNYLQAEVLARSINTNEPDFTNGDPLYLTSKYINKNSAKDLVDYVIENYKGCEDNE